MNATRQEAPSLTDLHPARGPVCPACAAAVPADAQRCPSCGFTGGDTMTMFPGPPPPLLPLLDAAGLWDAAETHRIETAAENLRRRFPQFHFHVCSVMLPPEMRLPAFGFWLLNTCPLDSGETAEDRAWAVLLLINARTGQAAVVPGYSAEPWLGDDDWTKILSSMAATWTASKPAAAVIRFFETTAAFLDRAWKLRGLHSSSNSRS